MSIRPWLIAIRPKTLFAAIAPVFMGTAMAYGDGLWNFPVAIACLGAALSIQIGTNLANDYFDHINGVDTPARLGPLRVTQSGLIPAKHVQQAFTISFVIASVIGACLVIRGGWVVLLITATSILSGIFYAGGPKPLSHLGLGDIFAFIFFGPVAVAGTYFIQTFECNTAVLMAGCGAGFWSVAILTVNNLRDIDTDARAGKKTLAVRWGKSFARMEYLFCLVAASAIPVFIYLLTLQNTKILFSSLMLFICIPVIHLVFTREGVVLNKALGLTSSALFLYAILFSFAWIV